VIARKIDEMEKQRKNKEKEKTPRKMSDPCKVYSLV
jgi:hypothetical protein